MLTFPHIVSYRLYTNKSLIINHQNKKEMKKLILSAVIALAASTASIAQSNNHGIYSNSVYGSSSYSTGTTRVSGHVRRDGTYVQGHTRTSPNSTNWDNYSTKGNTNPYTGSTGTRARDYSVGASNYGLGHIIQTGPRGGQYYYNSRGNKTYVPKR